MLLHNTQLQTIDPSVLKQEILAGLDKEPDPGEEDIKNALADLYLEATGATAKMYYSEPLAFKNAATINFNSAMAGRNLWERLHKFICSVLSEGSTVAEIIDAVLEALASIIPGGIIIKWVVKKIVRYILNLGYLALCPVQP